MKYSRFIKSIAYAYSQQLNGMATYNDNKVKLIDKIEWHELCVKSHPSMVSESKMEDKNLVVTTTIKMYIADSLPQSSNQLAFKVTLIDGTTRLVGSNVRPYPAVEITESCPESVKDNQLDEVVITYKSTHFPYYILE